MKSEIDNFPLDTFTKFSYEQKIKFIFKIINL